MYVVSPEQMKTLEKKAVERFKIPVILLMENAAAAVAALCLKRLKKAGQNTAVVLAGKGNNGGDGFAVARFLHNKGIEVEIVLIADSKEIKGDALTNLEIARSMGIGIDTIEKAIEKISVNYLVIDAMIGTGLNAEIKEPLKGVIQAVNQLSDYCISIDIPSGVNGKTGKIMGTAVYADETVTLGLPKTGILLYPGAECTGKLHIADISIPQDIKVEGMPMYCLTKEEAASLLPLRPQRSNKGTFGRLFVVAGSRNMAGAAVLACKSGYRAGAGVVYACAPKKIEKILQTLLPEAVEIPLEEEDGKVCSYTFDDFEGELKKAKAVVMGCGLGQSAEVNEFAEKMLVNCTAPIVLDADGLNAVASNMNLFKMIKNTPVVTPHPGEMSRLTGKSIKEILDNPIDTALEFAQKYKAVTVLKDARTVIASPEGRVFINLTGNSAMAKGGSGDVLSGVIGAFLSQGLEAFHAAVLGVYVHGFAGDIGAKKKGEYGLLASELADYIPIALKKLQKL